MKNNLYIIAVVALGIFIGGLELYQADTVYQDHENLASVVNFLNSQITASQKQQEVSGSLAPVVSK